MESKHVYIGDVTPELQISLVDMVKKNKTNEIIVDYVQRNFGLQWSVRTLKRRLRALGIERHGSVPERAILNAIKIEMDGPSQNIGYRHMHQRLRIRHDLPVKRNDVYQGMKLLDPQGLKDRQKHVCKRREYVSVGSNWIWHLDGHDKLKPYGFAIHAAIDGFSRKIIWCHVDATNNDPTYIAKYYYEYVKENKVIPSMTRSDAGTENGLLAICQMFLRRHGTDNLAGQNSHVYGSSMRNQRIEAYWHNLREHNSSYWETTFEALVAEGLLVKDDPLHKACLQYVYMPLLRKEMDNFVEEHNCHRIRKQRGRQTPQGIPEDLYYFPERAGFKEAGFVPEKDDIEYLGCHHGLEHDLPTYFLPELQDIAGNVLQNITVDNAKQDYKTLLSHLEAYIQRDMA